MVIEGLESTNDCAERYNLTDLLTDQFKSRGCFTNIIKIYEVIPWLINIIPVGIQNPGHQKFQGVKLRELTRFSVFLLHVFPLVLSVIPQT